jgi:hypothetical protein
MLRSVIPPTSGSLPPEGESLFSGRSIALRFGVNNTLVSHYVSGLREIPAEFAVNVIHWVHQVAQERARFAADALFRLEEAKEVSEPETLAGVG